MQPLRSSEALNLVLDDADVLAKHVPRVLLLCELLGLGSLVINYDAAFINRTPNVQTFTFAFSLSFIWTDGFNPVINLFSQNWSNQISRVYTSLDEVIYAFWKNLPIYNGKIGDISCDLLEHEKPVDDKDKYADPQLDIALQATVVASYDAAATIGVRLAKAKIQELRQECNESVAQCLVNPLHSMSQLIFKTQTATALIRLFAALLLPAHKAQEITDYLSTLKYFSRQDLDEYLEDWDDCDLTPVMRHLKMQRSFDEMEWRFDRILRDVIYGDAELDLLQTRLQDLMARVRPDAIVTAVAAPAIASTEVAGLHAQIERLTQMVESLMQGPRTEDAVPARRLLHRV